ncbi:glutathione S-transferase family protein [Raoultella planticola]|uniref:glutathione S-transferase family protein n=1 Tax=Raoultella planticola TaxID=575 RepID=UPI0005159525|nr:glutathione S-transferase [Raoultella planticola]
MMTVYGVPGWGSAISELMLTLANIPYHFVNVAGFDQPGPQRDSLMQINPLCQVPTLRLDDGSVMTESAAIALMILDSRPDLAPAPGTPQRWTADAPEQLRENCIRYRQSLYLWLEQQLTAAPYALGADMSLLDCYIAAMCSWGPRRAWFMTHTPKFVAVADKVYQRPELQQVLRDNELI